MKLVRAVFAFAVFCAQTHAALAACKSEACRQATAWKHGYTAMVLDDAISSEEYQAILKLVKESKGAIAIEAESILLGWIPPAAVAKLRAARGVRFIHNEAVPSPEGVVRNGTAVVALEFFNQVKSGHFEDMVETGLTVEGEPLTGCVVEGRRSASRPGDTDSESDESQSKYAFESDGTTAKRESRLSGADRSGVVGNPPIKQAQSDFWGRTPYQNPDMRDRVTVQVFRLDSDGRVDPNVYSWTLDDMSVANNQVLGAFSFWANEAASRNVPLSFRVSFMDPWSRYIRRHVPTPTRYEPIHRESTDDYLWVNDALERHGYGASTITPEDVYSRNEAFNRSRKTDSTYGSFDRSFSVFIVYNPGSAPKTFADGWRAYAMYDGPFTMLMWDSAGWGPSNLGRVITHETGHIFWACDEYYDAGSNTGCVSCDNCHRTQGPRNRSSHPEIRNANCESGSLCDIRVDCIMRRNSYALCPHTPSQVGW